VTVFINPGSRIGTDAIGWTNTHAGAAEYSAEWMQRMSTEGFTDIEVTDTGRELNGRWVFEYRHSITGVVIELEHHGIDDLKAYEKQYIFTPRVYWGGSSCGDPRIEDFSADGFAPVITYRVAGGVQ
jgi:hypothetical protein